MMMMMFVYNHLCCPLWRNKRWLCLHGSAPSYLVDELCQVEDVDVVETHQRLNSFLLVFIADRQPHSTVYHRRSSLSGCRCSCIEQFANPRHFDVCLPVAPQESSFFVSFPSTWLYSVRAMILCYFGRFNRSCYLLLTYMYNCPWCRHPQPNDFFHVEPKTNTTFTICSASCCAVLILVCYLCTRPNRLNDIRLFCVILNA